MDFKSQLKLGADQKMLKFNNSNDSQKLKKRSASKIFLIYLIIGSLWVLFTDAMLYWLYPNHTMHHIMQTPKGWFSILITGIILYFLIKRENKIAEELYNKEYESRIIAEEAKQKLEESEKKYKTLIEQAADGIFSTDMEGNLIDLNESGCKILGYTKEESLKLNIQDIIDPEDFKINRIKFEELKSGKPVTINRIILKKDGTRVNVEVNAKMLSGNFIQAIVRDVTERKIAEDILTESEKRYKELFTSNPNPMWVYDLETLSFLDVNEAAIYNYGYSREEFLSMTLKDIRPQEEIPKLLENIKTAPYGLEYSSGWQHLKKDGSIIDVEIRSNALDHQGRKAKLVSAIDVTWRKKSEEEIKKSREELRALTFHLQSIREEERAAISRELHDELGQLLTSIKMNLVMMGKELTVQFKNSDTEYFEKEIGAMSELLDISVKRVRKIITELRPEVLLNLELYDAIEWQIKEFSNRSGIKCNLNYSCREINFDSDFNITIFRIIQEALTNVMRHSGADNVEVKISCENERVILSVADNGKGIKNSENIPGKSFGILGIRERAILLGGDMDIKSHPGKGTELLVSIPLKKS